MVGWLPQDGQAEVWADSPDALISTVPAFVGGTFEPVDGGVRVNAKLSFSSGVDPVDWLFVMGAQYMLVIPRSDFAIVDDWFVMGLKGTGSKGVLLDDVFVPEHRLMPTTAVLAATHNGAAWSQSPYYHVTSPVAMVLDHFILALLIRMTWGLLDIFEERVTKRIDPQAGAPAHTRPGAQLRFAEAHAEVEVAGLPAAKQSRAGAPVGSSARAAHARAAGDDPAQHRLRGEAVHAGHQPTRGRSRFERDSHLRRASRPRGRRARRGVAPHLPARGDLPTVLSTALGIGATGSDLGWKLSNGGFAR